MQFLNVTDIDNSARIDAQHRAYREYLETSRDSWPGGAFEFAISDWHYDTQDHRCPHDSWLQRAGITENRKGEERYVSRGLAFEVVLLGAYHDGELTVQYADVESYTMELPRQTQSIATHGDWLIDELRLSPTGTVLHEIQFHSGARWLIECSDVVALWRRFL